MKSSCDFYKSLDRKDLVGTVEKILGRYSRLYAGTVGLDNRPRVGSAYFMFEHDGAMYFITAKSSRMYAELCRTPYIQMYAYDDETDTDFRLSGKVCFTEDEGIIGRCVREHSKIAERVSGERKALIAFFLIGARAELSSRQDDIPDMDARLPEPSDVLVGITIRKKAELRDRISRVLERREAEPPEDITETSKLYDGALFVFAEAAKALWPRMDITPVERAALFETYDEREKYTMTAAKLIGNAVIDTPEDITYWLDPDTLGELREKAGI